MLEALALQLLGLFRIALFLRIIIDYIRMFARSWRPNTLMISVFEIIYTITDKPMSFVRRHIPPLRIGGVSIDLSIVVLLIAVDFARRLVKVIL